MDYSERRMRAEIVGLPGRRLLLPGRDRERRHRGASPTPSPIDVHVQGDEIVADYQPQLARRRAGRSTPRSASPTGAVYNGMLHLTDPSIPKNSGCFRPIRVVCAAGHGDQRRLSGPAGRRQHRDASAARQHRHRRHVRPACRERAMASESCTGTNFVFGGNHPGL